MNIRKMFCYSIRIILISLLFFVIIGQGGIGDPVVFAEEDVFEALQITRFPEPLEAPDFSLMSLDGDELKLSDYKGNVIFLNFWTTW